MDQCRFFYQRPFQVRPWLISFKVINASGINFPAITSRRTFTSTKINVFGNRVRGLLVEFLSTNVFEWSRPFRVKNRAKVTRLFRLSFPRAVKRSVRTVKKARMFRWLSYSQCWTYFANYSLRRVIISHRCQFYIFCPWQTRRVTGAFSSRYLTICFVITMLFPWRIII